MRRRFRFSTGLLGVTLRPSCRCGRGGARRFETRRLLAGRAPPRRFPCQLDLGGFISNVSDARFRGHTTMGK